MVANLFEISSVTALHGQPFDRPQHGQPLQGLHARHIIMTLDIPNLVTVSFTYMRSQADRVLRIAQLLPSVSPQ
jgi:hypothetical protein